MLAENLFRFKIDQANYSIKREDHGSKLRSSVSSVYLNRKATAWYQLFPPMHSPDRAKDTKKAAATVASGYDKEEASSASRNDDNAAARPVASGSEDESKGEGQE